MTPAGHITQASMLALAASDNAIHARAFKGADPAKARQYAREAEAALYAALDALSQSGLADLSDTFIAARAAQQERAAA